MKTVSPVLLSYSPTVERSTPSPDADETVSDLGRLDTYKKEKQYSLMEVSHHCDPSSCWVVINNYVYDITHFRDEHPGGPDILLEHAGRDCTVAFRDKGHSLAARELLKKYQIGVLIEEERIVL